LEAGGEPEHGIDEAREIPELKGGDKVAFRSIID
jgi:hypothetical protein